MLPVSEFRPMCGPRFTHVNTESEGFLPACRLQTNEHPMELPQVCCGGREQQEGIQKTVKGT